MVADERRDLVALLRTLSDDEWNAPSLCAGWRVRDVVAHLASSDVTPRITLLAAFFRNRMSVNRLNNATVERAKDWPTDKLIDDLESTIESSISAKLLPRVMLGDAVVHHQDIRRPLGKPRTIPGDRLLATLRHPDPFALPWRYTRGLRFVATDLAWSKGKGPEVRGPGEAIALATAGRLAALDDLEGDGLPTLRQRLRA